MWELLKVGEALGSVTRMALLATLVHVGAVLALTWWVLARFRDALVPPAVLAAVFGSWSLGFLGLLLLPMDITANGLRASDRQTFGEYLGAWEALYWLTFALSWVLLPILAELRLNGEFSLKARLISSLRNLVLHWSILGAAAGVVAFYLVFVNRLSLHGVLGLAMASANTYGLLWLVALLGYGLVDIPRSFWILRTPERKLQQMYFTAVQLHEERMEALFLYDEVQIDVASCYQRILQAESDAIILTSDMQHAKTCLDQVVAMIDGCKQVHSNGSEQRRSSSVSEKKRAPSVNAMSTAAKAKRAFGLNARSLSAPTISEVVALHRRVRTSQLELRRCEQAWIDLCVRVEKLRDHLAKRDLPASCLFPDSSAINRLRNAVIGFRFRIHTLVTEPVSIGCAGLTGIASLCILWGEATMGWNMPSVSLFRWIVAHERTDSGDDDRSATAAELVALLLLLYMVVCAYSSLFKLRWFGKYALVAHGNSTELCLLKTSTLLCRLQFSLAYNVLLMLNDTELTDRTAFHALFDRMHVVHVFGQSFSVYAPIVLVVLVGLTLSNAYARVMASLGLEQYEQLAGGSDAATKAQAIAKGEQLVQKALERHRALISRQKRAYDGDASRVYGYAPTTTVAQSLLADDDHEAREDALV